MASRLHTARAVKSAGVIALLLAGSGCVTVYQPLVGLQRPIAIDPLASNTFDTTRVLMRCHQNDGVEADALCRNLRTSFSKQGATVTTEIVRKQNRTAPVATSNESPPQFIIDITSKLIAESPGLLSAVLCAFSFTLVPYVAEETYGQDIVIRDAQGFILSQQSFQERFVSSFGLGVWALNGILDLIVRPRSEQVTGDGFKEEFTRDFHGHLGQLLYNAKVRARVMRSFEPESAAEKPKGASP